MRPWQSVSSKNPSRRHTLPSGGTTEGGKKSCQIHDTFCSYVIVIRDTTLDPKLDSNNHHRLRISSLIVMHFSFHKYIYLTNLRN